MDNFEKIIGKIIKVTLVISLFYYSFKNIKTDSFSSFMEWFFGIILLIFLIIKFKIFKNEK